jgi:hypothetical protein
MDGGVVVIIFWLLLSAGVGMLADSRGRSWFGFFLLAVFLSPLLGLIVVLVMRDEKKALEDARDRQLGEDRRMQELKTMAGAVAKTNIDPTPRPVAVPVAQRSVADELSKLASLRDSGVLTDAEFQAQKALLLKPAL